jgi:hypothetical protein
MSRLVLLIGLTLLGISFVSFIILSPLSHLPGISSYIIPLTQPIYVCGVGCQGGLSDNISDVGVSRLIIKGELPEQMNINTSDTIAFELTLPRLALYKEDPRKQLTPTPIPINRKILIPDISHSLDVDLDQYCFNNRIAPYLCSDGFPMSVLFGSGYEVFASAYLITTSFDVQLLGQEEQSANQTRIEWDWNIFPKTAGSQIINIGIILHWKPTGNKGKEDIFRQIWQSSTTIEVNPPPFIQPGQITISGAVSGFFGLIFTGFSLTWMYEERKKRHQVRKKINETKVLNETQQVPSQSLPLKQEIRRTKRRY